MKRLQPVIWAKGTFLTPQHLQIQDRFIEDTLGFTLGSLNYRPWGFGQLSINQEALAGIPSYAGDLRVAAPGSLPRRVATRK